MAKFVLAYRGGGIPETEAEQEATMQAWMGWFGSLGAAVVDGGNPFGASTSRTADGPGGNGAPSQLTGYSIVEADDLDAASEIAAGCPVLTAGGSVDVYEAIPM
jgi:hypothetical protein